MVGWRLATWRICLVSIEHPVQRGYPTVISYHIAMAAEAKPSVTNIGNDHKPKAILNISEGKQDKQVEISDLHFEGVQTGSLMFNLLVSQQKVTLESQNLVHHTYGERAVPAPSFTQIRFAPLLRPITLCYAGPDRSTHQYVKPLVCVPCPRKLYTKKIK